MNNKEKEVIEEINNIESSLCNVAKIIATNQDIDWRKLMYTKDALGRNCMMFIETWYNKIMDIRVMAELSILKVPKEKIIKRYKE